MKPSTLALLAVCAGAALPGFAARAADLAGRYVVASVPPRPDAAVADALYAGTVNVTRRGQTVAVAWQLAAGPGVPARRLRGLGLADADVAGGGVLGVSLATGGQAYGVGVYRHDAAAHEWVGRWITSLDGGGSVGEIRFDDGGGRFAGQHRLTARRAGSEGFEGTVGIAPAGEDFAFTFTTGRAVLYRGVGVRLGADRLVVGWSFGSAPAVAAYQVGPDGLLTGRRVGGARGGEAGAAREALAREGADAARLLPVGGRNPADPTLIPGSPPVKTWNYEELQARYGAEGWAERWLAGQLTGEEGRLLNRALHRQQARAAKGGAAEKKTIGELIEAERRR